MKNFKRVFLLTGTVLALFAFTTCKGNIGLGETVDTQPAEIAVNYPEKDNVVIMEEFYVGGTCSDDKGVERVEVTLLDEKSNPIRSYDAELYDSNKKWKLALNAPIADEAYNGWTLKDGQYSIKATAYDKTGAGKSDTRSFKVDNTAPFFVASNPGVSSNSGKDFSPYGSTFSLEGEMSDLNSVSKIALSVYDENGNPLGNTDTEPFTETNVKSGSVSILFARARGSGTQYENYDKMYDLSEANTERGTKELTCSVTLTDEAKIYKDPENLTSAEKGNSTSTVYLNDDIYNELLDAKNGFGFTVSTLREIFDGTTDKTEFTSVGGTKTVEEIRKTLAENAIVTEADTEDEESGEKLAADVEDSETVLAKANVNRLGFTLNPDAFPVYDVSGFALEGDKPVTAVSGQTLTISASMGQDKVKIEPATIRVWIKEYEKRPGDDEIKADRTGVMEYAYGRRENVPDGWKELYNNKDYNSSSQSNYTLSVALNSNIIKVTLGKFYVVAVSGNDQAGEEFAQKTLYGFDGNAGGNPPALEVTGGTGIILNDSGNMKISGTATASTTDGIALSRFMVSLKVYDVSVTPAIQVGETKEIELSFSNGKWTEDDALSFNCTDEKFGSGTWEFTPSALDIYDKISAAENSEKTYRYDISALLEAASGHTTPKDCSVNVDAKKPVVKIGSITPVASGDDDKNLYVNGKITFRGSVDEDNYKDGGFSYTVYKITENQKEEFDAKTIEGKTTSFTIELDTAEFADKTEIEVVFRAEDNAGNVEEYSSTNYGLIAVDKTPPAWKETWKDALSGDDKKFTVAGKEHSDANWYKDNAPRMIGCFEEAGSGLARIEYFVKKSGENEFPAESSGQITLKSNTDLYIFDASIGGFEAGKENRIRFVAYDNVGNASAAKEFTIQRDNAAPSIEIDGDSTTFLTNCELDIQIKGTVSDDASGISTLKVSIPETKFEKTLTAAQIEENLKKGYIVTLTKAGALNGIASGTYSVNATLTDNAGNSFEGKIVTLKVDVTAPEANFSAETQNFAKSGNGKKDVTGSVTEQNTPVSLKLFWTKDTPVDAPTDNSGKPSGWTQFGEEITEAQKIYNWTFADFDFTAESGVLDTTDGKATVYMLPVVVDEAGNSNAYKKDSAGTITWNLKDKYLKFNVDAASDRPVVTFSDLTDTSSEKDGTALVIKGSEGGVITGLVSDDDGVEKILISSDEITSANAGSLFNQSGNVWTGTTPHTYKDAENKDVSGYDKFEYKDGSWTFTPADPADGEKKIYIYVKDTAGTEFYTTATRETGYTKYNNPLVKIKTGTQSDNTDAIKYTSDNNNPDVSSFEIKTAESKDELNGKNYARCTTAQRIGGKRENFVQFRVTAKDNTGITGVTLALESNTKRVLTLKNTQGDDYWESEVIDLKEDGFEFEDGEITVKATATDKSLMTGTGSVILYADFKVEVDSDKFTIYSPTATVSGGKNVTDDVWTSDLTIRGMAADSAGIESVQWGVPLNGKEVSGASYDSYDKTVDESVEKWSTGRSSDSYTQWSFIFDGDTSFGDDSDAEKKHYELFENFTKKEFIEKYAVDNSNGVCSVPVYFRITDTLGNIGYVTNYVLRYNPDADRPKAEVIYPGNGNSVGSVIRVSGSAQDNVSVSAVYIQISSQEGVWSQTDSVITSGQSSGTANNNKDYLKIVSLSDSKITNIDDVESGWWGIKADNTVSWSLSVNEYGELAEVDSEKDGKKIWIRACAVDNGGKAGVWSDVREFTVYKDTPAVTFEKVAQYTDNEISETPSAQNPTYEAGSYLSNKNGQWYAVLKATHAAGIKTVQVSKGTALAEGNKSDIEGKNVDFNKFYKEDKDITNGYRIYIPVDARYDGELTYSITATEPTGKQNTLALTYKIDNTAPVIAEWTSEATRNGTGKVAGDKIVNSDGGTASLKTVVTEDNSGFTTLAYYWKKKDVSIWNPIPDSAEDARNVSISVLTQDPATDLYGKKVTGTVGNDKDNGVYIEASSEFNKTNIRAGGLIRVEGIFYQIKKVENSRIYVMNLSGNLEGTEVTAFCPYALVIQYNDRDTTSSNDDDGDDITEEARKTGSKYSLETNIDSALLPDGEIELVYAAFDKAGNVSTGKLTTMISNNLPRLSKLYLATDLNGDGKFSDDEFVYTKKNNGVETAQYAYSCLDANGNGQEVVTLTTTDDNGVKLAVKDAFAVTMELLTGAEKDSYENIRYYAGLSKNTTETPVTGKSVLGKLSGTLTEVTGSEISKKGVIFGKTKFQTGGLDGFADSMENDKSLTEQTYLQFTLWDNVNIDGDDKIATLDTFDDDGKAIKTYGNQWTLVNIPVFIDITDDVAPEGTVTPFFWNKKGHSAEEITANTPSHSDNNSIYYRISDGVATPRGHIELGKTPSVSGVIVVRGDVSDDQLIGKVEVAFNLNDTQTTVSSQYTATTKTWSEDTHSVESDGYKLLMSDDSLTKDKHTAKWTLYLDSAKLGNAESKTVAVTTTQGKEGKNKTSAPGIVQTTDSAKTGCYAMKVVPYITNVERVGTKISSGVMNRSRFGRYAVSEGETVKVYGYNFGTNPTVKVKEQNVSAASVVQSTVAADGSFTMTVPAKSGELAVTNVTASENNSNDNDGRGSAGEVPGSASNIVKLTYRENYYNREVDINSDDAELTVDYTDDRYLSVWALGNYFNGTDGGVELRKPVMTADKSGNLYASWVDMTNSQVKFSYGVNKANTPVFRCYDQPAEYTGISFDTKGTSGGANVGFMAEHQGYGASFSLVALASNAIVGGAGTVAIQSSDISSASVKSGMSVVMAGNPSIKMDSAGNESGYYTLQSYDMNRRLAAFVNPKSARFGNYLHNIYYDTVTESLRYSVTDTSQNDKFNANLGAIVGWVVIDGGYTGQDRVHAFNTNAGNTNNVLNSMSEYGHAGVGTTADKSKNKGKANYTSDIFLSRTERNEDINYIINVNQTSLTLNNVSSIVSPSEGNTIALLYNKSGDYKFALRTITNVNGNTVSWDESVPVDDIQSATIYCGNMNVVGGATTADFRDYTATNGSPSAGSSADIDVDTDGKPIIAYYDAENSALKVAYASVEEPDLASDWKRYDTSKSCTGEVSLEVDGNNGIHIMYKNKSGKLCYIYGATVDDLSYAKEEVIDSNGSLDDGSLSVVYDGSKYVACVAYFNNANTDDCIKYAFRRYPDADAAQDRWDYMIVPSLGSGHYAVSDNCLSLEGRKQGWTSNDTSVLTNNGKTSAPATVDAAIAFKSKQFETAYLKSE